jgi:hypothetical protein
MRLLTFLLVLLLAVPAMAQEEAAAPDAVRVKLAEQMHEIWPIRPRVETALTIIAETMPEENRLAFKAQMRKNIQFDLLEQESVNAMARVFTEDELKKMIEFYGSPEGRSISAKTEDYEIALQPVLTRMMDKAVLDTRLGQSSAQ